MQELHELLKLRPDVISDGQYVYFDSSSKETKGNVINDLYNRAGPRAFTQPIRASEHVILGGVPEFVFGQRGSVKCMYYGDSVERVVMRPGEFVVTDMHFNKTKVISLGRSRLAHDPVIHIVFVWTRLMPAVVTTVKQMLVRSGCSGSLQPYRHYGGDVSPLACINENHLNDGSRIGDLSVRIVKPAAFLRWAYRHFASTHMTDETSPWNMWILRMKPKSREPKEARASRRSLSCEALQALQASSHGGQASHPLNDDVQDIVDLDQDIH